MEPHTVSTPEQKADERISFVQDFSLLGAQQPQQRAWQPALMALGLFICSKFMNIEKSKRMLRGR